MPEELSLENPLVIVGDEDVILGFRALGFKPYALKDPRVFKVTVDEIIREKSAVCLVQEDIYLANQDEINNYKDLPFPVFIPFSKTAPTDLLNNMIKEIRLKATGAF